MRIKFFTEYAAHAAVKILERYGFGATRLDTLVLTDCPTLLAVPVIVQGIGFDQVEQVDIISPVPVKKSATGEPSTAERPREACRSQGYEPRS